MTGSEKAAPNAPLTKAGSGYRFPLLLTTNCLPSGPVTTT